MPRSGCRTPCGATRTSFAARRAWRCRSASASTPARSWCARSGAICAWTTPPWARARTWRRRMEQLAAPGTIRLTAETLHLAEGFVQVTPLGPVPIKGLGEPVEVFELVGAGAARTRLEAAARRGLTRFVGRDAELEQLRGALDRASLGHGQVVAVVGEPGVGKSRLFWELTHSYRVHGWLDRAIGLGLLRQGHRLPSRDRAAPRLLRDRQPRRPAEDPGEGHGEGPDARPRARARRARPPGAPRRAGGRGVLARPRSAPATPADARCGQAPATARERGPAAGGGLRGSALDRRRDPDLAR